MELYDEVLAQAFPYAFNQDLYASEHPWRQASTVTNVLLQWDPDHNPKVKELSQRAIQPGLRGNEIATYAKAAILEIIDVSDLNVPFDADCNQRL
ncbi:MAG: DUF4291 domain-containing protein [Gammaproteobacteria bacterium]|nr:DUF4291 domain-containing protein [Gammaproteobacteria bacterium]